jgi:hypothetical protein
VAGGNLSESLSVRARFERLPASIKGAFILRGEDADPHQVEFRSASIVAIGSTERVQMPIAAASLDAAPHRDVFVPFEAAIGELGPGWYTLEAELEVDGVEGMFDGGRRFAVAWPRATVRRGQVKIDRDVAAGDTTVRVEHLDLGGDTAKLHLQSDADVDVDLTADGERLPSLEVERDEPAGHVRVTTYPVLRSHRSLRIEIRGANEPLEVPLPE